MNISTTPPGDNDGMTHPVAMDQFSAHLDRGWDLALRGDAGGATSSARRALDLDGESPEAYNLLGYASALSGDPEEAVQLYEQAIALDDEYLDAILNLAALMIHPMGNFVGAERYAEDALGLAGTREERLEVLLLKFEALLGQDKQRAAKDLLGRLPAPNEPSAQHSFLLGRAWFEVGEFGRAKPALAEAALGLPDSADAHYYLGMTLGELDEEVAAVDALITARDLDQREPDVPWALARSSFRTAALAAWEQVPQPTRAGIEGVELFVTDLPGAEMIAEGVDPRSFLMLELLPDAQDAALHAPLPSGNLRVFIYKKNVERAGAGPETLTQDIASAISQELQRLLNGNLTPGGAAPREDELAS